MTRFLFVAFLILPGVASSQSAAPKPDTHLLRLGRDSLEVFLVRQGHRQRTGLIVDALDTVRGNGELRLRRVYRTNDRVLGSASAIGLILEHHQPPNEHGS